MLSAIVLSHIHSELEQLLATQYYSGRLLPCQGSSDIFVPLLKVLDQLLVVGVIQEDKDLRRLLELLDPEQFVPKKTKSEATDWSTSLLLHHPSDSCKNASSSVAVFCLAFRGADVCSGVLLPRGHRHKAVCRPSRLGFREGLGGLLAVEGAGNVSHAILHRVLLRSPIQLFFPMIYIPAQIHV